MAAYAVSPAPSRLGGAENMTNRITALVTVPIISHGLNWPHLVLVLATITPMIGSLKASKTRAIKSMAPIAAALTPMIS